MKSKVKLLSLILSFVIIAAMMPIVPVSAADMPMWYYSDGFDDVELGSMPNSTRITTYNSKGNGMGVAAVPSDKDRSICIEVKSRDDSHYNYTFSEALKGKLTAEFAVRIDDPAKCSKNFIFYGSDGTELSMMSIDGENNILSNGSAIGVQLVDGKFTNVALSMDLDKMTYDIYVNYKLRAKDLAFAKNLSDVIRMRVHLTGVQEDCKTKFYTSEIKIYESDKPLTPDAASKIDWKLSSSSGGVNDETLLMIMGNKMAFFADAPKGYVNGKTSYIDANDKTAAPFVKDGVMYLPVRYAIEGLGGTVKWNESDGSTDVVIAGGDARLNPDKAIIHNGNTMDYAYPVIQNSKLYMPADAVAEISGKELFYDSTGLAILSSSELSYNWYDDEDILKAVIGEMIFERPTGEQILSAVEAKHPNNNHPRIFGTQADFDRIKNEIATSDIKKAWFDKVKTQTESIMKKTPVVYGTTDGIRMRTQSEQVANIVGQCSFLYKITGEERYADRAWQEMESLFAWPDWNPNHFLDIGQFMHGVAIGYDWLYDYLTAEQKAMVIENLTSKGLNETLKCYLGTGFKDYAWVWRTPDNWTLECNSGAIMAALAICDEERDISVDVLTYAMQSIEMGIMSYAPDGPWYEGVSYWQLSTETMTEALISLETAAGSTYGLLNAPGVAETGYYPYTLMGAYTFNFSDAGEKTSFDMDTKELFYLSEKLNDPALASLRYQRMQQYNIAPDYREFFYCKGDPIVGEEMPMELDKYYRVAEAVAMRNSWNVNNMFFGAMHSGENAAAHGHLDIGQFVIDSFGDRFAADLGHENYNLAGTFFNKYRNRAEGHNTLFFNPSDISYDQDFDAYSKFEIFESNEVSSIAITDMTPAYKSHVTSARRGMKMTNGRSSIIIRDEVRSDKENELYWFMNTKANVEISSDGKTAILDINGNKMEAKLLTDEGVFTVMDSKPLPTSPIVVGQDENKEYRKLTIHFDKIKDVDIAVCFTPHAYIPDTGMEYPEVAALDKWTLDDPATVEVRELPYLTDLKVDGKTITGFESDKKFYITALKKADDPVPQITAEGNGTVEVVKPEVWPGNVEVKVKKGPYTVVYGIRFNAPPESLADKGYTELDITEASAQSVPQAANGPANTLDNDFETRYAGNMPVWVKYDLGESKQIDYISLAMYSGDQRRCQFYVEVSDDNQNWTKIFQGETSGSTTALENFAVNTKGRYIRVTGTGLIYNGQEAVKVEWFSPTEFKAYSK